MKSADSLCKQLFVTVLPAKSDRDIMFCLQSYQGLTIDISLASADPEGGTGGPDPPWKITSYMGFYRE